MNKTILEASEIRYRRLFEAAQDGILILDADTGRINDVNPFLVDMLGYSKEEIFGKKLWEIGAFIDRDKSKAAFQELQTKEYVRYEDLPLKTKDGRFVDVEFVSNVYEVGHKKTIQCNIRDISERMRSKRTEENITQKVYHEIRNPLAILKEGSRWLLDRTDGGINTAQEKIITIINTTIERMIRMTVELLDISKLEEHKIELQIEAVDAKKLIREVIAFFELNVKEKGLEIRSKLPDEEINVYSDKDKIFQVFSNLIGNAIKFTEKGYIEVSVGEKKDHIEFSVLDTGRGISKNDLPRVFGKFEQFGQTLKGHDRGVGLGLVITKDIIELSKGKIWVESELGKGSKFIFTLPKAEKNQ